MEKLSHKTCIELLKKYDTPKNIFEHSRKVNGVAMFIATKLKEKNVKVNVYLVDMGSLLHDIRKWHSVVDRKIRHTMAAGETLVEEGYPEVGNIAAKHGLSSTKNEKVLTWEEKIVNYADKRVKHDKIVSVNERLGDAIERYKKVYAKNEEYVREAKEPLEEIEKEIFDKLDIEPEDINEESVKPFLIEDEF